MKIPFEKISTHRIIESVLVFFTIGFYSLATVSAKFASGYPVLSGRFILFYGLELIILVVYAVLWQQILKRFPLSVAYSFRSLAIFWVLLWSVTIFHNSFTLQKIIGIIIVCAGTVIVSSNE